MAFRRFSYSAVNPKLFLVTGLESRASSSSLTDEEIEYEDQEVSKA